jgi:predicted transposase
MFLSNSDLKLQTMTHSRELLETIRRYNEVCNFVSDKAFSLKLTTDKYKLHKIVYAEIRERQV